MFKKRFLCIVMTLVLLLTSLAGCRGDSKPTETTKAAETTETTEATEPTGFELILDAADADLSKVEYAELDDCDTFTMITYWDAADVISWKLKLPEDNTYTLRFVYSTDEYYEACSGVLSFAQNGKAVAEATLPFPATDHEKLFSIVETTVELPKGACVLSIRSDMPDDCLLDFINLVKIQVCLGDVPAPALPPIDPDDMTDPTIEVPASPIAGWWKSLLGTDLDFEYMVVSQNAAYVNIYDKYGESVDSFDCRLEGDLLTIFAEDGEETVRVKDDRMYSLQDDTDALLEMVLDPVFCTAEPNFDGSWYRCGDTKGSHYDISEMTYRKMGPDGDSPAEIASGEVKFTYTNLTDNTIYYFNHLGLELTDSAIELIPSSNDTILIEDDDYTVYVREDLATEDMIPICQYVEALLNNFIYEKADGEYTGRSMYFTPYSFFIIQDNEAVSYGQWNVTDSETLQLIYEKGDLVAQYVQLPEEGMPLCVGLDDAEFYFDD